MAKRSAKKVSKKQTTSTVDVKKTRVRDLALGSRDVKGGASGFGGGFQGFSGKTTA